MLLLTGTLTGVLLTITGGGGSVLAIPLLSMGLQLPPTAAMGLSLGCVCMAALPGSARGLYLRRVDLRLALPLALCGILLAPLGRALSVQMDPRLVTLLFSLLALFIAWRLWPRQQPRSLGAAVAATPAAGAGPVSNLLAGAGLGMMSGFFGVGGGFLIVPWLMQRRGLEAKQAIPTSLLVIACVSASGYTSHLLSGGARTPEVLFPLALGSLMGACAGIVIASRLGKGVPEKLVSVAAVATALSLAVQTSWW